MTASRHLEALVIRMQNEYLDTPYLPLTVREAEQRFGADGTTCQAILDTLVDARVLARTEDGEYVRFFPRAA
jgi:DNA-binding IclR family transcriptional regulator